jgi:hypothetical protein
MESFKELKRDYEQVLDDFFHSRSGRNVNLEEVDALARKFKAEHLPQGQAAIAMAKKSKMLKPRSSDVKRGLYKNTAELKQHLVDIGIGKYGMDGYDNHVYKTRMRHGQTWADALAANPGIVKSTFDIPEDADPAQTVAAICEQLIARSFDWEFRPELMTKRVETHRAELRKRGYHAVLEAADKPGVTLSDLRASAQKALTAPPNLEDIDAWHDRHIDSQLEGADPAQAVDDADALVRARQLGDLEL